MSYYDKQHNILFVTLGSGDSFPLGKLSSKFLLVVVFVPFVMIESSKNLLQCQFFFINITITKIE